MKRTLVLINCFATATLVTLGLSTASASPVGGTIFLDNAINISSYSLTVNPGTGILFGSSQAGIQDMAFTSDDVLLVAASAGIYAYSYPGTPPNTASTQFNVSPISNPFGLAIDPNGNVYVGANGGATLEELSSSGVFEKNIATGVDVESLAVDSAGDIFEADGNTGNIMEYFAGGGSKTYNSTPLGGSANYGITFDAAGNLFVTYVSVCAGGVLCGGIDEITSKGTVTTFYTTNVPPGGVPNDVLPVGLAYDAPSGDLFMSYLDTSNGTGGGIEVFPGEGAASAFATVSSGFPGAIADLSPEPGSIVLFGGGLALTMLLHFRRVRRLAQAAHDQA